MNRQQKESVVELFHKDFLANKGTFFVNFAGLSVVQMQQLRRQLREKGGALKIAKMRLVKRALADVEGSDGLLSHCKNQLGVVFAYDADADSYQKLRQFTSSINNTVEQAPTGPLLNLNGVLYGTTELGGSFSKGSLYKINTDGTGYQVIHEFEDDNGYYGNLMSFNNQIYGMTKGGYSAITFTGGTSYRLNPDGSSFQTIHVFGDTAGIQPTARDPGFDPWRRAKPPEPSNEPCRCQREGVCRRP